MGRARGTAVWLAVAVAAAGPAAAETTWAPSVAIESRMFPRSPEQVGPFDGAQWSLVVEAESRWDSADGRSRVLFEPYARFDAEDPRRSYADIRELSLQQRWEAFDLLVGVSRVSWGVVESRKVVDVINQIDALEDIDEDEKLGQPMVRISRRTGIGTFEGYWLPYFRERRFPSVEGRLRSALPVANRGAAYRQGRSVSSDDLAIRFQRSAGAFDLGLHAFHGTDRIPRLTADPALGVLRPTYVELAQAGLDLQWTGDVLLLRAEYVAGQSAARSFTAWAAGFEYTIHGVFGSVMDLGLVAEQSRDSRTSASAPVTPFDDDHFLGMRLTGNDVQDTGLLIGAVRDRNTGALQAALEFSQRVGTHYRLEVEARAFDSRRDPLLSGVTRDDNLLLRLTRYF